MLRGEPLGRRGALSTCSQPLFSTLLAGSHFAEEKNSASSTEQAGSFPSSTKASLASPQRYLTQSLLLTDFLCFCNVFSCPSSPYPCSSCYGTLLVQTVATKSASQSLLDLSFVCEGETMLTDELGRSEPKGDDSWGSVPLSFAVGQSHPNLAEDKCSHIPWHVGCAGPLHTMLSHIPFLCFPEHATSSLVSGCLLHLAENITFSESPADCPR